MGIFRLIEEEPSRSSCNVQTKEVMQIAKVLKLKLRTQLENEGLQERGVVPSKHYIINIDQEENQELAMSQDK